MLDTYMTFGGVEIINGMRLRGYARTADCPLPLQGDPCPTLAAALGESYDYSTIALAPWFDPKFPESVDFYGIEAVSVVGLSDTQRAVSSVEGLAQGKIFTSRRKNGISARFEVTLFARTEEAMSYGVAWLSRALDPNPCDSTTGPCGVADLEVLADCPPEFSTDVELGILRRRMLDAVCISGPLEKSREKLDSVVSRVVEFTIESELPYLYGDDLDLDLINVGSWAVETSLRNRFHNPQAETSDGETVIAQNVMTNPSFETGLTTGWTYLGAGVAPLSTAPGGVSGNMMLLAQRTRPSGSATQSTVLSPVCALPTLATTVSATAWIGQQINPGPIVPVVDLAIFRNGAPYSTTQMTSSDPGNVAGAYFSVTGVSRPNDGATYTAQVAIGIPAHPVTVTQGVGIDAVAITVP